MNELSKLICIGEKDVVPVSVASGEFRRQDTLLGGNVQGPVPGQHVSSPLSAGQQLDPSLCVERGFDTDVIFPHATFGLFLGCSCIMCAPTILHSLACLMGIVIRDLRFWEMDLF